MDDVRFRIENEKVFKAINGEYLLIGVIEFSTFKTRKNSKYDYNYKLDGFRVEVELFDLLSLTGTKYIYILDEQFNRKYFAELSLVKTFGTIDDTSEMKSYVLNRKFYGKQNDNVFQSPGFCNLHVHSEYSLLDGLNFLEEIVAKAKRLNMPAVALTDHGTIAGAYKFAKLCKKAGIKGIIGCEFYFNDDLNDKEVKRNHVIVLAKNLIGYRNLVKLSSKSHLDHFYKRARINFELLKEHKDGLIVTQACMSGKISSMLLEGKSYEEIGAEITKWKAEFGEDYYFEIMPDKMKEYTLINKGLLYFADKFGIKCIATSDSHYTEAVDKITHDVLIGIQYHKTLRDGAGFTGDTYWFMSEYDMFEKMTENHPYISPAKMMELVSNTKLIADKCEIYEIDSGFRLPAGKIDLNILIEEGLKKRGILTSAECVDRINYDKAVNSNKEFFSRLNYERDVIKKMELEDYFIVISDIVEWAKSKGIQVAPGRGSVGGSLLAYILGITDIDPLKFGLIFERFLNPGRKCLHPETLVSIFRGEKKIKDLAVGEKVLTSTGEFMPILNIFNNNDDKKMLVRFSNSEIRCTENHKWIVFRERHFIEVITKDLLPTDKLIRRVAKNV